VSTDVKRDPVRLGSDPPPEGSESTDSYEAPTRVGESAYVILARAMVEDAGPGQPPTSTATTAPPPPLDAAASAPPAAEAPAGPATPSEAPASSPTSSAPADYAPRGGALRTEVAIAIASFLAVAIPAVLYVMYLR
jgi:hypothetical protein